MSDAAAPTTSETPAGSGNVTDDFFAGKTQQEEHTPPPVLELSALAPKREIISVEQEVDGQIVKRAYELAVMADFGIEEQQVLTAQGREFDRLWRMEQSTSADLLRLKQLLDSMFEKVFRAPPEIRALINDEGRSQIIMAFTLAPLAAAARKEQEAEAAAREQEAAQTQTSENSPADSGASTDAAPGRSTTG